MGTYHHLASLTCVDVDSDGDVDGMDFAYFRVQVNKMLP
jgi:hypothetical protein